MVRWVILMGGVVGTFAMGAAVDRTSHSLSDTFYGAAIPVLLLWLGIGVVLLILHRREA